MRNGSEMLWRWKITCVSVREGECLVFMMQNRYFLLDDSLHGSQS